MNALHPSKRLRNHTEGICLGAFIIFLFPVLLRAADPAASPSAVPTFECVGLYWKAPGGAADKVCEVSYRVLGDKNWRPSLPLWFDPRNQEYRGSIVHLRPGTTCEIALQLKGTTTRASLRAQTWIEAFPVRKTVEVPVRSSETLTITESGSPEGYVLYAPAAKLEAVIDVAGKADHCVVVKGSYIIVRGLTVRNARIHGVLLGDGVHDVVIEECDISGWGRVMDDGWGKDYDSAIYSRSAAVKRIIVQRNRIHHPRSNSNNWQQSRPAPGKREPSHPEGPQAVCLWDSEGNHVIRYNTVFSDDAHQYNDIFGAGHNFSTRGFPNRDSDIYGNHLSHCWDDAIESEGANCNVRIWGNYITEAYVGVACASTSIGPLYVWRNITGVIRESPTKVSGAFLKTGDQMGGGKIHVFHNTILQPVSSTDSNKSLGAVVGLGWGGPMTNVTSRNNILHVTRHAIWDRGRDSGGDYDYDLFSIPLKVADGQETHGLRGVPEYVPGCGLKDGKGVFALSARSPGFDGGVVLPNFNDGASGAGPDIGAHEAETAPMEFGVAAYRPNESSGEALYNGIVLPSLWPPQPATWPHPEPVVPPYLVSPPSVIPIDVGRQLFVDDFLIEETTLRRAFHLAEYYPGNPVLRPDRPWESEDGLDEAMAFSDGVWFDPKDNLFKVWYVSGKGSCTCYATSTDGIHWDKPALDVELPSNIVLRQRRDSATVWLDLDEKDPRRRFKMTLFAMDAVERNKPLEFRHSPDGIHWSAVVASNGYPARSITLDRTTMFYNPFRQLWVLSLRDWDEGPQRTARCRYYVETPDLARLATLWQDKSTLSKWASADRLDRLPGTSFAQLYNLDAVAYESLLLGAFSINTANADPQTGRPKINQVKLGYSRDGFHWHRPDRRVFLPVSETTDAWNWGNMQSVGGVCLVVGDRLYFYVSGRTGRTCTVGLAFLRRDGFASMDAGPKEGTLTTRPVRFSGKHLFVNVDDPRGELRVEILNQAGQVVAPFTSGACVPVTADKTLHRVRWEGVNDLSSLVNQPVRFRFRLTNGRLHAFWVSPEPSGASRGYVAAGGPGFFGNRDLGSSTR